MRAILVFVLFFSTLHAVRQTDLFSVSTGIFDLMREKHRTWEVSLEYKFHFSRPKAPLHFLEFRPLVGAMATVKGSTYLYAGLNLDLFPCDQIVVAPGFAAGWYQAGNGKNLGYPVEFRSGVELAWQFKDASRLGIHFYHLSNAGLGRRNPGEESFVLFYDIPIKSGFPFSVN